MYVKSQHFSSTLQSHMFNLFNIPRHYRCIDHIRLHPTHRPNTALLNIITCHYVHIYLHVPALCNGVLLTTHENHVHFAQSYKIHWVNIQLQHRMLNPFWEMQSSHNWPPPPWCAFAKLIMSISTLCWPQLTPPPDHIADCNDYIIIITCILNSSVSFCSSTNNTTELVVGTELDWIIIILHDIVSFHNIEEKQYRHRLA